MTAYNSTGTTLWIALMLSKSTLLSRELYQKLTYTDICIFLRGSVIKLELLTLRAVPSSLAKWKGLETA